MNPDKAWRWLRDLLAREAGFQTAHLHESGLSYHLTQLAHQQGHTSAEALISHLYRHPESLPRSQLIEALLNYETRFFRDPHLFSLLQKEILPSLLRQNSSVRIWSAACATGQEAYSLALLWDTYFANQGQLELFASDLSAQALNCARAGQYPAQDIAQQLAPEYLANFRPKGELQEISSHLRRSIQWRQFNLIHPWPAQPQLDLLMLRNVLIYLRPEHKLRILTQAAHRIRSGGYLILGISESLVPLPPDFKPVFLDRAGGCFMRC